MIQPRNDWVVLRLIEKATRMHGTLVIPETKSTYCEAEVIAVGPGNVAAAGGRADTYDLKPGQLVFVQHKKEIQQGRFVYVGVPYRKDGKAYFVFDQSSVVGILAETCEGVAEEYMDLPTGPAIAKPSRQLIN